MKHGCTEVEIRQTNRSSRVDGPLLPTAMHRTADQVVRDMHSLYLQKLAGLEAQGSGTQRAEHQGVARKATTSSAPMSGVGVGETNGAGADAGAQVEAGASDYGVYYCCDHYCCSHCYSTKAGVRSGKYTGFPGRDDEGEAYQACVATVGSEGHQ